MNGTRWTPRRMTRIAAAGAVVIAMSLISGAESAAGDQAVDTALTYSCPFPSGAQQITARIVGTFPGAGTADQPIQPSDVKLTMTLPPAAHADLTKLEAASVAASAQLVITVVRNGTSTNIGWPDLAAPSTQIPDTGDLSLTATGAVPPATVTASGDATFTAGSLTLVLTPRRADGSATSPETLPLGCTLQPGQNAVLATVSVAEPTGAATPPPSTGTAGAAPRAAQQRSAAASPCEIPTQLPTLTGDAFIAGFSNVNKLNGATLIGREDGKTTGHTTLEIGIGAIIRPPFPGCPPPFTFDVFSRGRLDYNGKAQLPPAKATFLTFGFMPTTATLELTQPEGTNIEIVSRGELLSPFGETTTLTSELSIRIHDVRVNDVPLDVGPHCVSATPMQVTLTGRKPEYTVNTGGPLTGTATIPPFSGCGVDEDLDPLFTSSVSGPGNFMKLIQGKVCRISEGQPLDCPAERPEPQR